MTLCWHIKWYLSWMGALEYVSCINLTSALGYVSHTNQITAMRYACTNQSVTILSRYAYHIMKLGYHNFCLLIALFAKAEKITKLYLLSASTVMWTICLFLLLKVLHASVSHLVFKRYFPDTITC